MLPVQSPPIRPVLSPQNFYKTDEASRSIPEEEVNSHPCLPGRFPSLSCYKGGSCEKHPSVSDSPSVPGLCSKLQKVIPDPISGYHLSHSTSLMLSLPAEKVNKILDCCHRLLAPQKITLRNLASLIGLLESSRPAIWRAPLHFRHLQCDLIWGLQMNRESYDALIALSMSARGELTWWLKNTCNTNGSPVHLPPPDMLMTTDASMKGWGAVHQSLETNGRWSQQESLQHINYLELKAAFLALKTFLKDRSHVTVQFPSNSYL